MIHRARRVFRWFGRHLDEFSLIAIGLMFFLVASNTQTGWIYLLCGSIFGALLTAALSSRRAMPARQQLEFRLRLPLWVEKGTLFVADLSWQPGTVGYPGFWALPEGEALRVSQQGREQALLPPGPGEQAVGFEAQNRGVFCSLTGRLTCYGPLAWFPATRTLSVQLARPLVVLPRRLAVSAEELQRASGGVASMVAERGQRVGHGDLRRLREYHVGDDVRFIHWPSSARSGELIVRELAEGGATHLDIVCGCSDAQAAGAEPAWEWMLSWAYSYFVRAVQLGWQTRLLLWAGEDWVAHEDPEGFARARLAATPGPPAEPENGRRLDFWVGPYPGALPCFTFLPADYAGANPDPQGVAGRVLPDQVPS